MIVAEIPGIEIIRDVTDESEIAGEVRAARPDMVILFYPKLGQTARRLVPAIRRANPWATIVALATAFNHADDDAWRKAGAHQVFDLSFELDEFIEYLSAYANAPANGPMIKEDQ